MSMRLYHMIDFVFIDTVVPHLSITTTQQHCKVLLSQTLLDGLLQLVILFQFGHAELADWPTTYHLHDNLYVLRDILVATAHFRDSLLEKNRVYFVASSRTHKQRQAIMHRNIIVDDHTLYHPVVEDPVSML